MNFKEFLSFFITHTKNSDDVTRRLKEFIRVSNKYFITACDAEAIHPNINTEKVLGLLIIA